MNSNATPKSSTGGDIHELRYRISQLEHLIANNNTSLNGSPNQSSLPSNSTLLNTPNGIIQRANELEGLLAASESDNRNLMKQIDNLNAEKNRQEVILLEKLYKKDNELKDIQSNYNLLELKHRKAESKLENIKDYINELPCQEELDEARSIVDQLQEDNQLLNGKINRMTEQIASLQRNLLAKEKDLNDAQVKLEELKPLEDAQTILLKEKELNNLNLGNEKEILEFITVQKAQIFRSSKIILTLREKLSRLDGEKAEALMKITNQESDIESLQEQYLSTQLQMDKLSSKVQISEAEKTKLQAKYEYLCEELDKRNNYLQKRDEQMNNLLKLVTEIDLCVSEVGKLVELGQSIATGQEPSVSTLLGLSEDLELHVQCLDSGVFNEIRSDEEVAGFDSSFKSTKLSNRNPLSNNENSTFDASDSEWVLDRIKKIRDLRKNLNTLRDIANDLYTDILGGSIQGCQVQ